MTYRDALPTDYIIFTSKNLSLFVQSIESEILSLLANIEIFPGIFLGISLKICDTWLQRWIFLRISWIFISQAS